MKKTMKLAAAAAVVVMSVNASAFAEPRHRNETNDGWRNDSRRDSRSDSRRSATLEGKVRSFSRDNGGFRVQLDRDNRWYHVPQSAFRGRHNDLRIGVSIRLGGYWGGNDDYYVDSCDFVDNGYYDNDRYDNGRYGSYDRDYVRGIVERVDYRGTLVLREERSGRRVTVVMARASRDRRGVDLNDLRRGDVVTFAGDWNRGNVFEAYRIESVRNGRY